MALFPGRYTHTDMCMQMWVEKDEWQENPDIIHTKFA